MRQVDPARSLVRLETPTAGRVVLNGRDLHTLEGAELRRMRRNLQMVLQDPYTSLNPRMTVADIVGEPLNAAALLGRRADDVSVMPRSSTSGASASPAPTARRGDDVVPARVTDDGQRVVLGADREVERTVADAAAERGRQVADADVDREPGVGERTGRPRARLLLFELQLGVRVDPMAERDEPRRVSRSIGRAGGGLRVHAGSVPPCSTPTQRLPR